MERQFLYTERAHLMCPNMNFGIAAEIKSPFDENKIRHTLSVLVKAHPFLSALLGYEEDTKRFFFVRISSSSCGWKSRTFFDRRIRRALCVWESSTNS